MNDAQQENQPRSRAARSLTTAAAVPALVALGSVALASPAAAQTHTVRSGETLSSIAASKGLTVQKLAALNGITNPNLIFPGQTLQLDALASVKTPAQVPAATAVKTTTASTATSSAVSSSTVVREYVSSSAGYGSWRVWRGTEAPHYIQGTGQQVNRYLSVYIPTGNKSGAAKAAGLGSSQSSASTAASGQQAPAQTTTAPAATTPAKTTTTTAPAVTTAPTSSSVQVPAGSVPAMVAQVARQYGVNPALALAFAEQESSFQPGVISSAGAIGVMQVMPFNQAWLSSMAGRSLNLYNTYDNITAGVLMIKYLVNNAKSQNDAIAGYYQGLGAVQLYGYYPDTVRYVNMVNARVAKFSA